MPKGVPNKRYAPEFKKLIVETMRKEKLSYRQTARRFEIRDSKRIAAWEQIYLTGSPESFPSNNMAAVPKTDQENCRKRLKKTS